MSPGEPVKESWKRRNLLLVQDIFGMAQYPQGKAKEYGENVVICQAFKSINRAGFPLFKLYRRRTTYCLLHALEVAIWHSLHHYAYKDATFLAERLYAELPNEDILYTLASCYYQSGNVKRAHAVLQKHGVPGLSCRFLMAKCCFDLGRYSDAEMYLTGSSSAAPSTKSLETIGSEFGSLAGYSLQLLGHVYRKSDLKDKAVECYKASLKANHFLWSSFEALCSMGEKVDPLDFFKSSSPAKTSATSSSIPSSLANVIPFHANQTVVTVSDQRMKSQDSFAIENMDPSFQNRGTLTPLLSSTAAKQPQNMVSSAGRGSGEIDMPPPADAPRRHPVSSRNLLGAASSNSPLTPSFVALPDHTPTSDGDISNFVTPSPLAMTENQTVMAPAKKHTSRKIDSRPARTGNQFSSIVPGPSSMMPMTSPSPVLGHSSPQFVSSNSGGGRHLRRSTRLFGSTGNTAAVATSASKSSQKTPKYQVMEPMKTLNVRRTKTRRSRHSTSQPLTPTTENIMSPVHSDSKSRIDSQNSGVKEEKPSVTAYEAFTDRFVQLLQNFGKAFFALTQYDMHKAISAFENLPPHHYKTSWVLQQVALAHFEASEYKLAQDVFEEIRSLDSYHLEGMVVYSTLLWLLRREGKLSSLAQDLVELDKNSPEAWCAMGNCFSLQKEHDDAIKFLQRAIQLNPEFAYAYTLMGHEYVHIEELEKGMSCFRSALRIDDRHYKAWYGIAMVYYKQEKYVLAEKHYLKAIRINLRSSVLWCHLAVTQQSLHRMEHALDTVNKAIQLDPKNALCKYHKASFLFDMGRYEEALVELQELEKLVPKESLVYFLLGKIYRKLGQVHLAQMKFSFAMSLNPQGSNSLIKEAMNQLYLSMDESKEFEAMQEELTAGMSIEDSSSDVETVEHGSGMDTSML